MISCPNDNFEGTYPHIIHISFRIFNSCIKIPPVSLGVLQILKGCDFFGYLIPRVSIPYPSGGKHC